MEQKQKYLIFGVGVVIGVMMVANIFKARAERKQEADTAAAARVIPGMLLEWAREGRAIHDEEGKGVLESRTGDGAEGYARTRRVLVGGRRRFDALNREAPQEFLTVTEYYEERGELTAKTPVKRMDFEFADRIRAEVREPAQTAAVYRRVAPLGAHLFPEPGSKTVVMVRFEKPTLDSVPSALAALATMPEVVSASRVRIDWKQESAR